MSIVAITISVVGTVVAAINHKRIRSNCCGFRGDISLDIEKTTPPPIAIPGS